MQPLTVLIAQHSLRAAMGSELYTSDVALGLLRQGHRPVVFTTAPGQVSEQLHQRGVMVITSLSELKVTPDVVHGNHPFEMLTALARFPDVPGVFVCHNWETWLAEPPLHSGVRRYVGVDDACLHRLRFVSALPVEQTVVVQNGVDLTRFRRREPLPATPRRALVFSNGASEANYLPSIREACEARAIALDVVGLGVGSATAAPEDVLGAYDLVFAKSRAALEALATGCAVILCDQVGLGCMVSLADYDALRADNLGRRRLTRTATVGALLAEIDRYDAKDSGDVCDRVRETAGLDVIVGQLVAVYRAAIADPVPDPRPEQDWLVGQLERAARALVDLDDTRLHARNLEISLRDAEQHARGLETEFANAETHARNLQAAFSDAQLHADAVQAEFAKAQEWAFSLDAARTDLERQLAEVTAAMELLRPTTQE